LQEPPFRGKGRAGKGNGVSKTGRESTAITKKGAEKGAKKEELEEPP